MFGFVGSAQITKAGTCVPLGNSTVLIPEEFKSPIKVASNEVSYLSVFSKNYNGFVTVAFDTDFKIVEITAPKGTVEKLGNSLKAKLGPMASCVKECGGSWACGAACLFDTIFN
jgi:hypothetical protein